MRAVAMFPAEKKIRLIDRRAPAIQRDDEVRLRMLEVGVCGTDHEIARFEYGAPPAGEPYLVMGHESLGQVAEVGSAVSGLKPGDLVVTTVRRPCGRPECRPCAHDRPDFCRTGAYTERGIKERDGYCAERYRIDPAFAVVVDPSLGDLGVLLEPTSVVAKAWEHIERIGARARWRPARVLVTGAGPIGLLAALLARQRGLEVHVLDRVTDGPKPALVRDLGAVYHTGAVADVGPRADVVIECTGVGQVVLDALGHTAPGGIVCLTGVSSGGRTLPVDAGALNRKLVLQNDVVFGSVNANRRHYQAAADALAAADRAWLARLITRRVPLAAWADALVRQPDDVKPIIDLTR